MANAFIVYPSFPPPDMISADKVVESVAQIAHSRRFDRGKENSKDSKKTSYKKILEKEHNKRRWETGDVFEGTDIGDPGFFFDYKM